MSDFSTKRLPVGPDAVAPDGSDVRILLGLSAGGIAHFELAPGETSVAVAHRTVEEIWFFLNGRGEMWRKLKEREEVVSVRKWGRVLTFNIFDFSHNRQMDITSSMKGCRT